MYLTYLDSPPVVHALAGLCVVSGLILLAGFRLHAQERKALHLVDRPGTIGVVGAMLSSNHDSTGIQSRHSSPPGSSRGSSFLALLHSTDTNKDVEEKLKHKRFRLNPATGAIEMEGDVSDEMHPTTGDAPGDSIALDEIGENTAFLRSRQSS